MNAESRFVTPRALVLSSLLACASPSLAPAEVTSVTPSKDNTIYQIDPGYLSNGRGSWFFAGATAALEIRRALVRFDLSQIPTNATIENVTVRLVPDRLSGPPSPISLHALTADWGEGNSNANMQEGTGATAEPGDATWTFAFYETVPWAIGGEFDPDVSAAATITLPIATTFSGPGLVADVQGWVRQPATNFGWMLRGDESRARSSVRFVSRDSANAANRPTLTVTYTVRDCAADFNRDGQADIFDYLDFVAAFSDEDPSADFDNSGQVDLFDYLDFAAAFGQGC
ncbi:MAG: DNRLRE domain-containing protein [Planctomycetota bacterium]|nr:DNRLRE domain-containing protein [Planctomycetota bacterium]